MTKKTKTKAELRPWTVVFSYPRAAEGEWGDTWCETVLARSAEEAVALQRAQCWVANNELYDGYSTQAAVKERDDDPGAWYNDLHIAYVHEGTDLHVGIYGSGESYDAVD